MFYGNMFVLFFFKKRDASLSLRKRPLSQILTHRLQIVEDFSKVIAEICDLAPRQVM